MALDLSTLTLGQLEALAMVLESAISAGERAEAQGVAFTASVDLDEAFATVAFGWPCEVSARVVAGEGA